MRQFRTANWAESVSDLENRSGFPMFKEVELQWTRPKLWTKEMRVPDFETDEPFIYALVRNHWNSKSRDHIEYIGLTKAPRTRFGNHETAKKIISQRGDVGFSYAPINFVKGRNRIERVTRALEELEHLLIWAVGDELWNEKKVFTLPGMGSNPGNAWHVKNTGYRFSGRMPREIVYPWMLVVPGRDRTKKSP